jgi:energy-coupling factor transport system substrate-specific component
MLTALVVSVPVNFIFDNGYTGNKWGNGVIDYLLERNWPMFVCAVLGQLSIEFADKILTVLVLYLLVRVKRWNSHESSEKKKLQGNTAKAAIMLLLTFGLSMALPVTSKAATGAAGESEDYNDYVQSIYSSNNGLPCGEANDITQTNDGVLWIGTYAGLYRYNGREFRWVDQYDSVKNVNCLYVDEEGRLWIGTNDNGLSIVIREKLVNVLDQSDGLPSNSVRCITRASDGYYYIGTTSSMQIIMMNNGLKAINTLNEVNYTESICADEKDHGDRDGRPGFCLMRDDGEEDADQ